MQKTPEKQTLPVQNRFAQQFTFGSLMKFSIPTMVMMVFMSLYQTVDGVFVSNFVGEMALTALNVVYPFTSVVIAVTVMLATGGSALIGLNMGMGEERKARQNFSLIVLAGLVLAAVIAVLGMVFLEPMLRLLGVTPLIETMCREYLAVMVLATPLAVLQMLFQSFLVTAGKPRLGLILTVLSGTANIVLDAYFMGALGLGVKGAAWATAIGYGITGIYGLFYFAFARKGTLYFVKPRLRLKVLAKTCLNGSSEMVNNLSMAVTTLIFNIEGLRLLKEEGVAAISIILYAQYVMTAVFMGYSSGVAPIFSYKYGAGDKRQIRKLFRISMIFVAALSGVVFVLAFFVAAPIGRVFAPHNQRVLELAVHGFYLFAASFLFSGLNIFASALFTAFSNGVVSGVLSFLRTFVLLVIALIVLPAVMGADGIWLAVPLAEGAALVCSLWALYHWRKTYHLVKEKEPRSAGPKNG